MSEKTLWDGLGRFGFSAKARAAILANGRAESRNETNRLQGDFTADRRKSREYTAKVDSGEISGDDFVHRGPSGGGYGWLQWTFWSRKSGLYALAKGRGVSIGDEDLALDWMWEELNTAEFADVLRVLRSDASLREMTETFMLHFERPADTGQGVRNMRVGYAEEILAKFGADAPAEDPAEDPTDGEPAAPPAELDGLPVLEYGCRGWTVTAAQGALMALGFSVGPDGADGIYGYNTRAACKRFQRSMGIEEHGKMDARTWAALLLGTQI